jgi:hypothetical protein
MVAVVREMLICVMRFEKAEEINAVITCDGVRVGLTQERRKKTKAKQRAGLMLATRQPFLRLPGYLDSVQVH